MEEGLLEAIGFRPKPEVLARRLRIKPDSRVCDEFAAVLAEARRVARPKAAYRIGYIEDRSADSVQISGFCFTSRVLSVNLEPVQRVFFYLVTCGQELEQWSKGMPDVLYQYWADCIKEAALRSAARTLQEHLKEKYSLPRTSAIGPGTLQDFHISQQRLLFDAMGGLHERIGVQLSDTFLMMPIKSISGIRFPSEKRFESCQLCPRENCIGRRAPYDENLYRERFA